MRAAHDPVDHVAGGGTRSRGDCLEYCGRTVRLIQPEHHTGARQPPRRPHPAVHVSKETEGAPGCEVHLPFDVIRRGTLDHGVEQGDGAQCGLLGLEAARHHIRRIENEKRR